MLSSEQSRSNQSKSEGGGLISPEISGPPRDGVLIFIRRRETEAGTEMERGGGGVGSDKRLLQLLSRPLMVFSAEIQRSRQRGSCVPVVPSSSSVVATEEDS